jgi:hypothetical protein
MGTSSAQSDIISVMQSQLTSLTTVSDVVYINTPYNPTQGTPHLQVYMLFTEPSQASLGTFGLYRFDGILQIDVIVPVAQGRTVLNPILAELRGIFKSGTTLTNDNISIECRGVWESTPYDGEGWYVVPLNVRWYAYTPNS